MSSPEQDETDLSGLPPEDPTIRMEWPVPTYGNAIGPYRLIQPIGEGGMGEVWLAEQKEPVRRRVALKLVKAGMNTREVIARFESERQALALMDHPAIAKVFDAGSTPRGAPYFVMEYVAGVPITAYCDNHRLSHPRTAGTIHARLRRSPARASESHHPPRPETLQHPRHGGGWPGRRRRSSISAWPRR